GTRIMPEAGCGATQAISPRERRKSGGGTWCVESAIRENDVAHDRVDLSRPAFSAEHPVVPHARLQVMPFHVRLEAAAQLVCRRRLTDGTDVVSLTLDGEQRRAAYRAWVDSSAAPAQSSARERMLLENQPHRVQVELGRHVEDRTVLVVERLGRSRF